MRVDTKFNLRDNVRIDGGDVSGFVTAIVFRDGIGATEYEVSYIIDGDSKTPFIEEFRLEKINAS